MMATAPISAGMAGLQIGEVVTVQIARRERGERTDEQLAAEWAKMGIGVTEANALWEAAGGTT